MAGKPKKGPRRRITEKVVLTGVRQGQGATVTTAFGAASKPKPKKGKATEGAGVLAMDAFHPAHLPLPRAVAPYTVIRTTRILNFDANADVGKFALLGPMKGSSTNPAAGAWSNMMCVSNNTSLTDLLSATSATRRYSMTAMDNASWEAASITPAAFSVQVLNPEALQTSSGMLYIGKCQNRMDLSEMDNSQSFEDLANNVVSYCNPRICSAAKLALRGVQLDAIPNNMNELAEFNTLNRVVDGSTASVGSQFNYHFAGFNPIFMYNPNRVAVQLLVCCEWRVRFDPSNPAHAACRMHKPSSEQNWASNINKMVSLGNGVVDIVERVAQVGQLLKRGQLALPPPMVD